MMEEVKRERLRRSGLPLVSVFPPLVLLKGKTRFMMALTHCQHTLTHTQTNTQLQYRLNLHAHTRTGANILAPLHYLFVLAGRRQKQPSSRSKDAAFYIWPFNILHFLSLLHTHTQTSSPSGLVFRLSFHWLKLISLFLSLSLLGPVLSSHNIIFALPRLPLSSSYTLSSITDICQNLRGGFTKCCGESQDLVMLNPNSVIPDNLQKLLACEWKYLDDYGCVPWNENKLICARLGMNLSNLAFSIIKWKLKFIITLEIDRIAAELMGIQSPLAALHLVNCSYCYLTNVSTLRWKPKVVNMSQWSLT